MTREDVYKLLPKYHESISFSDLHDGQYETISYWLDLKWKITLCFNRNGFIHTILSGTDLENIDYEYYGNRVYDNFIQEEELPNIIDEPPLPLLDLEN